MEAMKSELAHKFSTHSTTVKKLGPIVLMLSGKSRQSMAHLYMRLFFI